MTYDSNPYNPSSIPYKDVRGKRVSRQASAKKSGGGDAPICISPVSLLRSNTQRV